jgi:hypothetical protein
MSVISNEDGATMVVQEKQYLIRRGSDGNWYCHYNSPGPAGDVVGVGRFPTLALDDHTFQCAKLNQKPKFSWKEFFNA